MSTLLWLLTEAGLVLCWLVMPWAPAPWLALCWLMAPLAGWLALLLTRKRSQVRLTCPVTAEKGKPFSVTAEVRQGVPFGRGRLTVSVENTGWSDGDADMPSSMQPVRADTPTKARTVIIKNLRSKYIIISERILRYITLFPHLILPA